MRRTQHVQVPGSVPGPVPRLGAVLVIVGSVLLLNPYPLWWWVASAAALLSALVPRSMASWIGIACVPMGLILTTPTAGRAAMAVLLVHVAHVLAAWAWAVPWRSRIRVRVLLPSVRRLIVIQVMAQSVTVGVLLAVPPLHGAGFAWLAPLGAAVLLAVSALVLRVSSFAGRDHDPAHEPDVGGRS